VMVCARNQAPFPASRESELYLRRGE
jgi:hypothetical protein